MPKELQKNFIQMRELDTHSQEIMKQIDKMTDGYLIGVRGMVGEKRKEHLNGIQKLFDQSKKFGDEKVQLALQTYELVDRHIRRLDADLARFEAEIKEKPVVATSTAALVKGQKEKSGKNRPGKDKLGRKEKDGKKKKREDDEDGEIEGSKKKKKKGEEAIVVAPTLGMTLLPLGANHPSDVLDMPVDPNEPTYCLCHQVSYGEMIGCDNQDCPIEWFHFGCVGLKVKPKGKWFCPRCTLEKKKKV